MSTWKSEKGNLRVYKNRPNNVFVVSNHILDLDCMIEDIARYRRHYPDKNSADMRMRLSLEEAEVLAYYILEELGHVEYRVRAPGEVYNKENAVVCCTRKSAVWNYDVMANQYPERAFVVERRHHSSNKWERVL